MKRHITEDDIFSCDDTRLVRITSIVRSEFISHYRECQLSGTLDKLPNRLQLRVAYSKLRDERRGCIEIKEAYDIDDLMQTEAYLKHELFESRDAAWQTLSSLKLFEVNECDERTRTVSLYYNFTEDSMIICIDGVGPDIIHIHVYDFYSLEEMYLDACWAALLGDSILRIDE